MSIYPPNYLQKKAYPARVDRQFIQDLFQPGVLSPADLLVTPSGVTRGVSVATGVAYVAGNQSPGQGTYRVYSDAVETLVIDPASTFPRIDQVIVRVYDSGEVGTSLDKGAIEILKGVEANGATLDNRSGAITALPSNMVRLFDVLAPVGSGTLSSSNLRDRRSLASPRAGGAVPIGAQLPYAGSSLPTDGGVWDWADGDLIDRVTYDIFFARVGHSYNGGVDPGSSKVRKPDKRGRSPVGATDMGTGLPTTIPGFPGYYLNTRATVTRGQGVGATDHSIGTNEVPNHSHNITANGYNVPSVNDTAGTGWYWTTAYAQETPSNPNLEVLALGGGAGFAPVQGTSRFGGNVSGYSGSQAAISLLQPVECDNWIVRLA